MRVLRIWVGGDNPGAMIVDIDPPLQPGEVEIDVSDMVGVQLHSADAALFNELLDNTRPGAKRRRR